MVYEVVTSPVALEFPCEPALGIDVLPPAAPHVRLCFDDPLPEALAAIALPAALEGAVPKRQMQFRAGRYCAMRAMEALDASLFGTLPGRAESGSPVWPRGIVGSITHTDDFAAAAVMWAGEAEGIGIDTERIMSEHQAREVGPVVAWASELSPARASGFSRLEALTLVFSAKESIFKCLHPRIGRMFGFHDVRLTGIDASMRAFSVRIARTLSPEFPAGRILEGRYAFEGHWVHTGVCLHAPGVNQAGDPA